METTKRKRIIIIGGGFAGIRLAEDLDEDLFEITLIDKNNYHQFQPLLYQVASSGLDPSSICFPFRKIFNKSSHITFKFATVTAINPNEQIVETTTGSIQYDYLVIAAGTTTNFFGNSILAAEALPMKTVEEAIWVRNKILLQLEQFSTTKESLEKEKLLNIVIVGGGATGVEVAGVLSEIKNFVIPKDYPEMKQNNLRIILVEAESKLLGAMSPKASSASLHFLQSMGVNVILNRRVEQFEDNIVTLNDGTTIPSKILIWVSGVIANTFEGIPIDSLGRGKRILINTSLEVKGLHNVFALGDIALIEGDAEYTNGHPQIAQVAIQQARFLTQKLKSIQYNENIKPFKYRNLGTMATIGRNKAVADVWNLHITGFLAWAAWLLVHIRSILGVKNKIAILLDWMWNYFNYHHSTRLIIFRGRRE